MTTTVTKGLAELSSYSYPLPAALLPRDNEEATIRLMVRPVSIFRDPDPRVSIFVGTKVCRTQRFPVQARCSRDGTDSADVDDRICQQS